jgi:hypothetical protein
MRKLAFGLGALCLLVSGAVHAQTYGSAGCGLGSVLFGNDNSTVIQILAATTNGVFGNQTFGITSGTLNCTSGGIIKAEREQAAFAEVNFQDLKSNMATGGGEFLSSFATLLGCEESAKAPFAKMTQEKFEAIYPATTTNPIQMLVSVKQQIKTSPTLSIACTDARAIARAEGKPLTMAKR